jgi:type II secretory pathway pseudopilin PulG
MNPTRQTRKRPGGRAARSDIMSRPHGGRGAFTLLELLLALGLIALFATVLIGGSSRLLSDKPVSADEVFWKACAEARKTALQTGRDLKLAFVDDRDAGKRFTVNDGIATKAFPIVEAPPDLAVSFLSAQKGAGNTVILAGQVVDLQSLPSVTFYADGTCTAFRVQIRILANAHVLSIDPWTCAEVLTPPDAR